MSRSAQITRVRPNEPVEVFFDEQDLPKVLTRETLPGDHVILEAGDYTDVRIVIPGKVYVTASNGAIIDYDNNPPRGKTENLVDLNRLKSSITTSDLEDRIEDVESDLLDHINDTGNPHNVTADQVGKDLAIWNANRIGGITVDVSNTSDQNVLTYDDNTGELILAPAAGGIDQNQFNTLFDQRLGQKSTDDLTEGNTNKYFNAESAEDVVNNLFNFGTGIDAVYDDPNDVLNVNVTFSPFTTDDLTEGTNNLYYTDGRVGDFIENNGTLISENLTSIGAGTADEVTVSEIRGHIDDLQRHVAPINGNPDPSRVFWYIDEDLDPVHGNGQIKGFFDGDVVIEGDLRLSGAILELSSCIYKQNITQLDSKQVLKRVLQLEPVSYEWKHNGKTDIGLIAEQVETVFPEFVGSVGSSDRAVNYSKMVSILIQSIQELHGEIERLKDR